ncbi:MAG TPA: AAA family ATPase [Thermoanaerobaculia bacterium]|nr:AAA family ATPase [Thermoanaerobaculia bacterium]
MSAAETIAALEEMHPAAVRLAESVSFAMMVDRAFLRAMRLALVPEADAGTEGDLWFSALVQGRTGDGIVLDPEVADALRRRMPPERVERIWSVTRNQHAWLPPSLQFEEEIAYLSVSREPTAREQLAERLRSVLAAMVSGDRAGLAQWAMRALAMFPSTVQELPEARMLETGSRLRLGGKLDVADADEGLPPWMPWLAPSSLGRVSLDFELREDELEVRTTTEERPMQIPATNPLLLEVSWEGADRKRQARQITFRPGETVTVPVGRGELRLRTIAGDEYALRERGFVPDRLREAIVDFSDEMQQHAEVIGREEEIAEVLALSERHQTITVVGEVGLGKTAFLCELIREAARRDIPVIGHYFCFGDLRLESIRAAERSLVAQIALRFNLEDHVLDMRLAHVLQRLRFLAAGPARLLIVLDDVDEARDVDRQVVAGAMQEMFPSVPDGVSVIVSATSPTPQVEPVHHLRPPTRRMLYEYFEQTGRLASTQDLPFASRNFAVVQLLKRLATRGYASRSEGVRALLDLQNHLRGAIEAAAVALRPLPTAVFEPLIGSSHPAEELLRVRGDEASILNDVTALEVMIETTSPPATAHAALLQRLEETRDADPRIRLYYLLNAPWHLLQREKPDAARTLCTDLHFMKEKIEKLGIDALIADFRMLGQHGSHTAGTLAILSALEHNAAALTTSPRDLAPILYTVFADAGELPPLPLVPELVTNVDQSALRSRKHDGPIRGSAYVRWADQPIGVTWSDDGTARLWPGDRSDPAVLDHGAPVTAFEVRHPYAISADANGFLHLWNLRNRHRLAHVAAHDRSIDGLLVDPAGSLIVTWSGNDPIRLWTWYQAEETIRPLGELTGHASVVAGCSLMPGGLLLSASRGGTCRLWSVSAKQLLSTIGLSGPATGITYHWDASSRIVMNSKRTVDIVHVPPSTLTVYARTVGTGHDLPVAGVTISSDGRDTATWSEDQTVRLWDVRMTGARRVLRGHRAAITACRLSEKHPWLVSADADGMAIVWNTSTGEIVSRFDRHLRAIRTIFIDGERIFTAGDDGIPMEWQAETGALITDFSKRPGRIEACAVIPGPDLTVLTTDGHSKIENVEGSGRTVFTLVRPVMSSSRRAAFVCAADGSRGYVASFDTWRGSPSLLAEVSACAIHDEHEIGVGTSDGRVFVERNRSWRELDHHEGRIVAMAFADSSTLVSASADGKLGVVDLHDTDVPYHFDAHHSRILALAALENFAVTGAADGTLRVWDLRSRRAMTIERAHDGPITGLWMEGNIVVTASLDRTVRVFDYKLGRQLVVCRGHRDTITGVAIAGYEEVIYSCSEDRTIRQWDIATGRQKAIVYGTAPFRCISWNDGKLVAGDDGGNLWTVKENAAAEPRHTAGVYLCYLREDASELAERLTETLTEAQIRVTSPNDATPRLEMDEESQAAALTDASTVVIIFSSGFLQSYYRTAFKDVRAAIQARKHIILLLQGVNRFDVSREWPELAEYESFKDTDWSDEESYRHFIRRLTAVIQEQGG